MRIGALTRCAGAAVLWVLASAPANSQSSPLQYVADRLVLVVREGPDETHRRIGNVATGDAVVVLETNDLGYARVRLNDGAIGWVQTQYLVTEPPASRRVDEVEEELAVLHIENEQLTGLSDALILDKTELITALDETIAQAKSERGRFESQVEALRVELEQASAKPHHQDLEQEAEALREQVRLLHMSNRELRERSKQRWFLAGGSVAVICLLLGAFGARIATGRRRNW